MKIISSISVVIFSLLFSVDVSVCQWSGANFGLKNYHVHSLAANKTFLFAGTKGDGVYRSSDNGARWEAANAGMLSADVGELAVSGMHLFAGTSQGLMLSDDNGTHWTAITNGLPLSIGINALAVYGNKMYAGTAGKGAFLSGDSGATWTGLTPISANAVTDTVYSLAAAGGTLFAGTAAGVFLSADSGKSWNAADIGLTNIAIRSLAVSGDTVFAASAGGGIFLSFDRGAHWSAANAGLTDLHIRKIAVSGPVLFAVTANDGIFISKNKGALWTSVNLGVPLYYSVSGVFASDTLAFAATLGGGVLKRPLSELMSLNPPPMPVLTSPADSARGVTLNPILTWEPSAGASSYVLEISSDSAFSVANMWLFEMYIQQPTLSPYTLSGLHTYYWRVAAENSSERSSWSTWRRFTTIIAPPMLTAPQYNAIGISTCPVFSWQPLAGALSYHLQVSPDPNFSALVIDSSGMTSSSMTGRGLTDKTLYYWRVNATCVDGTGGWSSTSPFTTAIGPPVLKSPSDGIEGVPASATFTWNGSSGALWYQLQVSTSPDFSTLIANKTRITATTTDVTGLLEMTKYYWRVNSGNYNETSAWSPVQSFTTTAMPGLISPKNGERVSTIKPILTWKSFNRAGSYRVQVSTDSTFTVMRIDTSGVVAASCQISLLDYNTVYYWRVKASVDSGTSLWSGARSFKTFYGYPGRATLISPANGSSIGTDSVRLVWHRGSSSVTWYAIEVTWDSTFTMSTSDTTITFKLPRVITTKTFTWKVREDTPETPGSFSESWSFQRLPTAIQLREGLPTAFIMSENYPNPFNPSTTFSFALPTASFVTLKIFDVNGRDVASVVNEVLPAGSYTRQWSAAGLPSGVYFYRLQAGTYTETKRLLLLR